jgi:exosortase/archaeosortase family protein
MKKRESSNKKSIFIILRYLILLILGLNLYLIYKIFTPLTVYSVSFLLKLIYPIIVSGTMILINQIITIEIIPACVAGSAYLLLLMLNLFVEMPIKKRIYSILLSLGLLFILNILRIFILTILLVNEFQYFDLTHKLVWYVLSTIFVIGIWFLVVKLFSIKKIPVYSDIKYIIKNIKK